MKEKEKREEFVFAGAGCFKFENLNERLRIIVII